MTRRSAVLALLLVLLAGATSANAAGRVPQGFVGAVLDGPVFPPAPGVDLGQELDTMVAVGVESARISVDWAATQPYRTWADVPADQRPAFQDVGGLPLRISVLDSVIGLVAPRRIALMLTVLNAPAWDAMPHQGLVTATTPADFGAYAAFLGALVSRYGRRGSFWRDHAPRWPVRLWQIWNEPNLAPNWAIQPDWEPSYVSLLRAAHKAVKRADRSAKVVLAGMVNASWRYVRAIYEIRGARKLFDVVGVHPYTHFSKGVITILRDVRRVMDAAGDKRKPIVADEVGWNSSVGKSPNSFGIETTEAGQAHNLAAAFRAIASNRVRLGLMGFDYYDWAGVETIGSYEFNFAGLSRFESGRFVRKPAFVVYRNHALRLERCRAKSGVATRCAEPAAP
jgi:Glycosyl hydrolase family 53